MKPKIHKGWFVTPDRPGDRTLAQQMVGLEQLLNGVNGKTVLDVGCAEGLIDHELAQAGASHVLGVEIVESHVKIAKQLFAELPQLKFERADANTWAPAEKYDVVLLLAILHKLKDPVAACRRFAAAARELVVVRMPPYGTTIVDERSGDVPHDIAKAMEEAGFALAYETRVTFDEWLGYYVPVAHQEKALADARAAADAAEDPATPRAEEAAADARMETTGDPTPSVDRPEDAVESSPDVGAGAGVDMTTPPTAEATTTAEATAGSGHPLFPEEPRRGRRGGQVPGEPRRYRRGGEGPGNG